MTLLCGACWQPLMFATEVPALCGHCGGARWVSVPNLGDEPKKAYKLSENDRRMLRSYHIEPEI